ncbi:hypothetical protein GQR58_023745 [Nymphon striatum]|nr:hypothetical protein GQR58_023745 [Nymphon striatum]
MELFERSWPNGFHDTICKKVTTMAFSRRHVKLGDAKVFDTETIYARAMVVQSLPTSMFDENGTTRDAKSKSNLKNALKVESSRRLADRDGQTVYLDGCAVLCCGYIEGSIKETTRRGRDKSAASRVYTLRSKAILPPQKVILTAMNDMLRKDEVWSEHFPNENLLAAHGLTGCDTVASCYGIGKGVALKVLRSNKHKLNYVDLTDVVEQATHFMIACYGQSGCSSFTEARTSPNYGLASLEGEEGSNVHNPITVPADILLVPPELLKLIKCCKSENNEVRSLHPRRYCYMHARDKQSALKNTLTDKNGFGAK